MSEKKQTALGFLESTFLKRLKDAGIFISKYDLKLIEKAKEMEKEQIVDFFIYFKKKGESCIGMSIEGFVKQYFKETYGE